MTRPRILIVDDEAAIARALQPVLTAQGWDVFTARLTTRDVFEPWLATLGGPADDHTYSIAIARNGDLLLGGYTQAPSNGSAPAEPLVLRVNPARIPR